MKKTFTFLLAFLGACLPAFGLDDDDTPGLDVPGQEQKLNAELWKFAKNTSFEVVQKDLEARHEESRQTIPTEVTLPNGWRMAPAGNQLELGRYPMVVVPFAGNLVVLNNGYYVETNPEISVVSGHGSQLLKTLTTPPFFPAHGWARTAFFTSAEVTTRRSGVMTKTSWRKRTSPSTASPRGSSPWTKKPWPWPISCWTTARGATNPPAAWPWWIPKRVS